MKGARSTLMSMFSGHVKGNRKRRQETEMGLTCGLWSLIGPEACGVLSYRHDVGGGRAAQFISTYESICQDLSG